VLDLRGRNLPGCLDECENTWSGLCVLAICRMSKTPAISVVIPTRNRSALLRLTLAALARQTVASSDYEVIVAVDGSTDDTSDAVNGASGTCSLRRIDLPWSGRAIARNRGAAAARGEILLFLDDDMDASPGLLEAHLRAHSQNAGGVVLGHFPIRSGLDPGDIVGEFLREWWQHQFTYWADQRHKFSFHDLCTGNVSLPRQTFQRAGGFDEFFPASSAGEDWELGYRLLKSGVPFRFASDALSFQHCHAVSQDLLRRAGEEGRGHVFIAAKHPELRDQLLLGRLAAITRNPWTRLLPAAFWPAPILAVAPAAILRASAEFLRRIGCTRSFWRIHRLVWAYHYWKGVRGAIPSWRAWKSMTGLSPKVEALPDRNSRRLGEQFR
jgi:glycosyltransferase involved in cell wall biosynthesis